MEPAQTEVKLEILEFGFRLGYNHVVQVLEMTIEHETHLNPHVSRVINEAFKAAVNVLKDNLENTIKELPCPISLITNPTNIPNS